VDTVENRDGERTQNYAMSPKGVPNCRPSNDAVDKKKTLMLNPHARIDVDVSDAEHQLRGNDGDSSHSSSYPHIRMIKISAGTSIRVQLPKDCLRRELQAHSHQAPPNKMHDCRSGQRIPPIGLV
jgi:hypothetical protein